MLQALSMGHLCCLDLSWNSLRGETARALHETLVTNGSLQYLNLSYNGFGDMDAALVLMGMSMHGTWRHVDLSYNNLGAGTAFVITELTSLLGKKAADHIRSGQYGKSWDTDNLVAGKVDSSAWASGTGTVERAPRFMHHEELGTQLKSGPALLDIGGNPLGFAGLRHVLHSLESMSTMIEQAAAQAAKDSNGAAAGGQGQGGKVLPNWPVQIILHNCNVDITDIPPEGSQMEGMDQHSPNPFLPSLMTIAAHHSSKDAKKKSKRKGKKSKGGDSAPVKQYFLTPQSQSLHLSSPAGKYHLDLAHPASWLLLRHLMDIKSRFELPKDQGERIVVNIKDVMVNERVSKVQNLGKLQDAKQGHVTLTVQSPAVLLREDPQPLTDQVLVWMVAELGDKNCNVLWKLSVIQVACSDFYFTSDQALQLMDLFDPEIALSERLRAGEMMYARCINPLDFWQQALPRLPLMQISMLMQRLGEFSAFDIHNPAGRYMFNLSRSLDRFMAMRLQEASALETGWKQCRYFLSWRNAQLNGNSLSLEGLSRLRDFTVPDSGTLRVDYCCYKVPHPSALPCSDQQITELISQLRSINNGYERAILKLRDEFLPYGRLRSDIKAHTPRGAKEVKTGSGAWTASKTMSRSFNTMLAELQQEAAGKPVLLPTRPRQQQPGPGAAASGAAGAPHEDPSGGSWWLTAGFAAAPAMLKKHADMQRAREQAAMEGAGPGADAASRGKGASGGRTRGPSSTTPADKSGRSAGARGAKGKAGKGAGATQQALPPPHLRSFGSHLSPRDLEQAEERAVQLLQAPRLHDVAQLLTKFSAAHIARLLHVYLLADPASGPRAAAALLECLAPGLACRFLLDMFDQLQPLLPADTRKLLLAAASPKLAASMSTLQAETNAAALRRARLIRVTLRCFAAGACCTSAQLDRVLKALRHEQDRCSAIVTLWSHVIDRDQLYCPFQNLSTEEQRQVMQRLGYWHVWSSIQSPHGMHFYLDLKEPEQKDIAKEIVKMACKATMAAKAQATAQGLTQTVQHLLELRGNGTLMTMPEDDKAWMSIESRYRSLEFDYAATPEQTEWLRLRSAITIQRCFLKHLNRQKGGEVHGEGQASGAQAAQGQSPP